MCVYIIFWLYPAKGCVCSGGVPLAVFMERNVFTL